MKRKTLGFILIAALSASVGLTAQNAPAKQLPMGPNSTAVTDLGDIVVPPVLSDIVKLQILNAAKDVEIGQLRLQQAQTALQQLIAAATPPGYELTNTLELKKIEAPKKEPGTQ